MNFAEHSILLTYWQTFLLVLFGVYKIQKAMPLMSDPLKIPTKLLIYLYGKILKPFTIMCLKVAIWPTSSDENNGLSP